MKPTDKRPKVSLLHDEIPDHLQEYMHLTRLAEMGRLAGSVAHEVNNPLMIAQGFAENIEFILSNSNHPDKDILRTQALEIIKACQRMSRSVNKMSRMTKNQRLKLHIVDIAEVALNAVDFLKTQFADLDIQIEFDFSRPMPIKSDVIQIEQVILNILSNAIAALQHNTGERRIRISFEQVGRQWQQIKIWNNGPLIEEKVQHGLMSTSFEEQAESGGLGLAISKSIMEVHGGDLTFYSREGLGTEFILSFPRPQENPWTERERTQKGPIIILDSHSNYRRTLLEKFNLLGFNVESCSSQKEGLIKINSCASAIAGVLIDIVPGKANDLDFVRNLRQQLGPQALIFAMSHYPSALNVKSELKEAGATDCFEKPLHADNFAFILKMLDGKQAA